VEGLARRVARFRVSPNLSSSASPPPVSQTSTQVFLSSRLHSWLRLRCATQGAPFLLLFCTFHAASRVIVGYGNYLGLNTARQDFGRIPVCTKNLRRDSNACAPSVVCTLFRHRDLLHRQFLLSKQFRIQLRFRKQRYLDSTGFLGTLLPVLSHSFATNGRSTDQPNR
jgi:hypothetical protein